MFPRAAFEANGMTINENDPQAWVTGEVSLQQILERPMLTTEEKEQEKETATAEEPDVVKSYLQEIGKIPLLNAQSKKMLAVSPDYVAEGARRLLIESNTRLVVSIAKRYQGRG